MRRLLLTLMFVCISTPVFAQESTILVADASTSGAYASMVKELSKFCSVDGQLKIQEVAIKGGAKENLLALANNKVSVALLHSDVIYASAQAEPKYRDLKTLIALYPEEIHIVALRNSSMKAGAHFGFGGKDVTFNSLGDLRGFKVGAAGGGVITARVLTGQGEGGFNVVQYGSGGDLLPALASGQVQAVVFVGGAPLGNIEVLSSDQYKLLPIPDAMKSRLQGIYHNATIDYSNLQSGPVATLAPDAIVLTRSYTRPQMIEPQRRLRQCFYDHLDDLKETPGMHPKWQAVNAANHGVWTWYDIPGMTTVTASSPVPVPLKAKRRSHE